VHAAADSDTDTDPYANANANPHSASDAAADLIGAASNGRFKRSRARRLATVF
jgi:hypothetical protein